MKIDEACIDYNVDRLVGLLTDDLYEWMSDDEKIVPVTLGEIRGIHQLAEALKEVLRT